MYEPLMISFFVPGIPRPGGSKRGLPIYRHKDYINKDEKEFTGHVAVIDANKKVRPWMADVKHFAYQKYDGPPLTGPINLTLIFVMPRPKGHHGTGKNAGKLKDSAPYYHTVAPDRTKLTRAVEDALTGVIWKDDAQVCKGNAEKIYGNKTGVHVIIKTINPKGIYLRENGEDYFCPETLFQT